MRLLFLGCLGATFWRGRALENSLNGASRGVVILWLFTVKIIVNNL